MRKLQDGEGERTEAKVHPKVEVVGNRPKEVEEAVVVVLMAKVAEEALYSSLEVGVEARTVEVVGFLKVEGAEVVHRMGEEAGEEDLPKEEVVVAVPLLAEVVVEVQSLVAVEAVVIERKSQDL